MTKISYIHGIGGVPQDEWQDRGLNVPKKSFIDYSKMTDGQLRLNLMNEQLSILSSFYPEEMQWKEGYKQLSDYLSSGVNGRKIGDRYLLPFLKKEINRAKWMNVKASRINGFIPIEDCSKYENMMEDVYGNITRNIKEPEYSQCLRDNKYKNLLNEHLEESAHHLLYNYVANRNLEPSIVSSKSLNHTLAIQSLASITGLSETNLKMWIRTGIIRSNVSHGTTPMQPEKTIETMKIGIPYQNNSKVGEPISVTILALIKIIGAITAAIAAASALVNNMHPTDQMKMQSASSYYGFPSFGPEESDYADWNQPGNNGTGGGSDTSENGGTSGGDFIDTLTNPDNLPLVLGGAAALYFISK